MEEDKYDEEGKSQNKRCSGKGRAICAYGSEGNGDPSFELPRPFFQVGKIWWDPVIRHVGSILVIDSCHVAGSLVS